MPGRVTVAASGNGAGGEERAPPRAGRASSRPPPQPWTSGPARRLSRTPECSRMRLAPPHREQRRTAVRACPRSGACSRHLRAARTTHSRLPLSLARHAGLAGLPPDDLPCHPHWTAVSAGRFHRGTAAFVTVLAPGGQPPPPPPRWPGGGTPTPPPAPAGGRPGPPGEDTAPAP